MKSKIYLVACFFPMLIYAQGKRYKYELARSPFLEGYLIAPAQLQGLGAGVSMLGQGRDILNFNRRESLKMRLGADWNFSGLGHHRLEHVPLTDPQGSDASVTLRNAVYNLNFYSRFSVLNSGAITPYVDAFAGLRVFDSQMYITPYHPQAGYQRSTQKDITGAYQLNCGAGVGVMIRLGDFMKLNIGGVYSFSGMNGNTVDLSSAHSEGGIVRATKIHVPQGIAYVKAGVTLLLYDPYPSSGKSSNHYRSHSHCHSWGHSNSINFIFN